MIGNIVTQVALKEGQKAAATFGSKLGTSIASALVGRKVINGVNLKDEPLSSMQPEEAEKVATKRTIRDASIGAGITMIGMVAHLLLSAGIEASN